MQQEVADVVVVGAGISGLAAAWQLIETRPGLRITVLEGGDRVGGKLHGGQVAGVTVDVGAESLLARRPEGLDLIGEIGLGDDLVDPDTTAASIFSRGRLHPMPTRTLMGVPSDPATLSGLLTPEEVDRVRAEQRETFAAQDISVSELVGARLGDAVVERLVEPLLGGVYAGQARLLSAAATLPAMLAAGRAGESLVGAAGRLLPPSPVGGQRAEPVFAGIRGGLHRLPAALFARLRARGVRVATGCPVRELSAWPDGAGWRLVAGPVPDPTAYRADAVVLATPPAPAARLLRAVSPDAAEALAGIETASLAVVTLAFRAADLSPLTGSGLLVPPVEGLATKAATFSAGKWGWVRELGAPDGVVVLRGSLGRHREEATLQHPDQHLVERVLADLRHVLGVDLPRPVDHHVQRWGGGLPQYAVGHLQRVETIRAAVSQHRGLAVCGAAYDGVGIPACIASGRKAAATLLQV